MINPTKDVDKKQIFSFRVYRGGSWGYGDRSIRVSIRGNIGPAFTDDDKGFRIVRNRT